MELGSGRPERHRLVVLAMFVVMLPSPHFSLHVLGLDIVLLSANFMLIVSIVNGSDQIYLFFLFPQRSFPGTMVSLGGGVPMASLGSTGRALFFVL